VLDPIRVRVAEVRAQAGARRGTVGVEVLPRPERDAALERPRRQRSGIEGRVELEPGDALRQERAGRVGRVHHRIVYFAARRPGPSVGTHIGTLRVSKQALNAPLRQLQERADRGGGGRSCAASPAIAATPPNRSTRRRPPETAARPDRHRAMPAPGARGRP
jgi:hypothetical protein